MKGFLMSVAAVLLLVSAGYADVTPMPLVPWDVESKEIKITVDEKPVPVGETRNGPNVRYCHFDTDKPVTVVISREGKAGRSEPAFATNDRPKVAMQKIDGTPPSWRFTMRPNTKVYLKSWQTFICASAPEKNPLKPGDAGVMNIADSGVKPNLETSPTKALQQAIDAAAKDPRKKTVYVPPGVYISGTLYMRDGVTLYLAAGAVLRGSLDGAEWKHQKGDRYGGTSAFIFFGNDQEKSGEIVGIKNASLRGRGVIDGWGHHFRRDTVDGKRGNEPGFYEGDLTNKARLIMAMKAENCIVEGITLRNPVFWTAHALLSKKMDFTDVRIYANFRINNDGIDYDSSTDSTIDNCVMITGDDSHCLKNEYMNGLGGPNERIRMANTIVTGFPQGVKFGWAIHQIRDCTYENNWLVNSAFKAAFAKGVYSPAPGPKIVEMTGVTLRDMVIDEGFVLEIPPEGGKKNRNIDGFKLENFRIENSVMKYLGLKKVKGVVLKNVTVGGTPITTAAEAAPLLPECTEVQVNAK